MHSWKRHQIHRDLVQIQIERPFKSHGTCQVVQHVGHQGIHSVEWSFRTHTPWSPDAACFSTSFPAAVHQGLSPAERGAGDSRNIAASTVASVSLAEEKLLRQARLSHSKLPRPSLFRGGAEAVRVLLGRTGPGSNTGWGLSCPWTIWPVKTPCLRMALTRTKFLRLDVACRDSVNIIST